MSLVYLYTDLSTAVNSHVHGKKGNLIDERSVHNRAVREVISEVDLRSNLRKSVVTPGIFQKVNTYAAPADLKDIAVADLIRQVQRTEEFFLTSPEEFDRRKAFDHSLIAVSDNDLIRMILIATALNTLETVIEDFESTTGFTLAGDGINLAVDNSDFINGSASLSYDSNTGGTTITLTKSTLPSIDLTQFLNKSLFLYQKIPVAAGTTNFILKWGTDASNYWTKTVTTTQEGLAFYVGWNLLRFDWPATATGTPVVTDINYMQLTITKSGAQPAQTGWHTDFLTAQVGDIHSLLYYSKYSWQSSVAAYIENSTADTDYLVCDTEEFKLFENRSALLAAYELRLSQREIDTLTKKDEADIQKYKMRYPSSRKTLQTAYHRLESLEGSSDIQEGNLQNLSNPNIGI